MSEKKIILDPRIYSARAVRSAVKEYAGVADVKIDVADEEQIVVTIGECPEEHRDSIEYEFCNFALWKLRN